MTADSPHRLLVAFDDSLPGTRALEQAAALAREGGAELHVVAVQEIPAVTLGTEGGLSVPTLTAAELTTLEASMDERIRTLLARQRGGAAATLHHRQGSAATEICALAAELHARLVVVGTHGRQGVARLLLGSVAEHVVRHAPCSVLVVREPRGE